jgi:secretion-regulating guanine nucleotide exchange factor
MSWGKGDHGQLGQGIFHSNSAPAQVQIPVSDDEKVIQIACGSEHGLVLTDSYKLYTFGWGEHGNLGHGDTYNSAIPQLVEFFQENQLKVVHITAGGAVSYAVVTR